MGIFDMALASSYNPGFVSAQGGIDNAFSTLVSAFGHGQAHLNIHTTQFPGDEIRAFPVPEPQAYVLLAAGLVRVGAAARRRRGR